MVPGYSEVSVIVAPHTLRYGGLLFKGAELAHLELLFPPAYYQLIK
jgi:hypothetical protein